MNLVILVDSALSFSVPYVDHVTIIYVMWPESTDSLQTQQQYLRTLPWLLVELLLVFG